MSCPTGQSVFVAGSPRASTANSMPPTPPGTFARSRSGGASYTYIRTWSTSGLRNPAAGVAGIMKLFTAGELRDQVNAVVKLAGR